jgi:ABC-type transport system involved in cytochrome c biogenesis permease subunit
MIRAIWWHVIVIVMLFVAPAVADAPLPVGHLGIIPIQQDGRLKPLEQFARVTLRHLSGSEKLDEIDALPWLVELLFTPEIASERPLFLVEQEALRASLALPKRLKHRYSAAELFAPIGEKRPLIMPIVMTPAKERSAEQQALMDLYQRFMLFTDLQQSFSVLLPLNAPRPAAYDLPTPLTYLDLQRHRETLLADAQVLAKKSKGVLEALTPPERDVVALAFLTERLEQQAQQSRSLRVMPGGWAAAGEEWFAPWALLRSGYGSPQSAAYLKSWQQAILAYREGDAVAWAKASMFLAQQATQKTTPVASLRLWLEYFYVCLSPLSIVFGLGIAGVIGLGLVGRLPRLRLAHVRRFLMVPLALLGLTLLARIAILGRPPVGTLYESLIFVAWVVLASSVLPAAHRVRMAAGTAIMTLLVGLSPFFAGDETMGMLTAVLNTDFWLTVHVLCITSGYGACLLASGMAHAELWRLGRDGQSEQRSHGLTLYVLAALGLTATGTLLGGVWADQSWGRFWGWDPKENGALLIVLWIVWLLHARQAGQLGLVGYVASVAALSVVVALAWFGVNMLGIGLHSYGFTEATAVGLSTFCIMEAAVIGVLCQRARRKVVLCA